MKILSLCARCGHTACAECMVDGDDKRGVSCCQCVKEERKVHIQAEFAFKTKVTESEEDQIAGRPSEIQKQI